MTKEQPKKTVNRAMLEELEDIRDMVEVMEKRSKYWKPQPLRKNALRGFLIGLMQGVGIFVGGTILVGILILIFNQLIRSGAAQNFLGDQIQEAVQGAVEENLPENPFGN